jgi:hypothetical protein
MKTPWGLLYDECRSRAGCDNLPITAPSVGAAEARGDSGSAPSRHADGVAASSSMRGVHLRASRGHPSSWKLRWAMS